MSYVMNLDHDQINTLVSALLARIRDLEADVTFRERTIDSLNRTISKLRDENSELIAHLVCPAEPAEEFEAGESDG